MRLFPVSWCCLITNTLIHFLLKRHSFVLFLWCVHFLLVLPLCREREKLGSSFVLHLFFFSRIFHEVVATALSAVVLFMHNIYNKQVRKCMHIYFS